MVMEYVGADLATRVSGWFINKGFDMLEDIKRSEQEAKQAQFDNEMFEDGWHQGNEKAYAYMIPKFNNLAEEYNEMFQVHRDDVNRYANLLKEYHDLKKKFRESLDRAIRCDCERFGRTAAIGFLKAAMSMRTNAPIVRDFFNIARNDNKYQYPNGMLCSIFDKLYSKNVPPVNGLNDALHKWHYRDEIPEGRVWITVLEGAYLRGYSARCKELFNEAKTRYENSPKRDIDGIELEIMGSLDEMKRRAFELSKWDSENLTWTLKMTEDEGEQLVTDWERDMERFNEYVKEKGYTEKELHNEKMMFLWERSEIRNKYKKEVEETGIRAFPI